MDSGGAFLQGLRNRASSLGSRARDYTQNRIIQRITPRMPAFNMPDMRSLSVAAKRIETQPVWVKILTLVCVTTFVGIFFAYIHKKESTFGYDFTQQILIVVAIVVLGIILSVFLKYNTLDFIISSQINLICFYFLISYAGLTTLLTTDGFFNNFLSIFVTFGQIVSDPTQIFEKGFSLIIPILLFLVPLFILINNATKSIWLALISIATGGAIVYLLYPKNKVNPIAGGAGFDLGTANCKKNWWEIWKRKC